MDAMPYLQSLMEKYHNYQSQPSSVPLMQTRQNFLNTPYAMTPPDYSIPHPTNYRDSREADAARHAARNLPIPYIPPQGGRPDVPGVRGPIGPGSTATFGTLYPSGGGFNPGAGPGLGGGYGGGMMKPPYIR